MIDHRVLSFAGIATELTRTTLLTLSLLYPGCYLDDEPLFSIPIEEPTVVEEGVRWREALPDLPPEDDECDLVLVWPLAEPPQGDCRPGWRCGELGEPPVLPTDSDRNCDGNPDDNCAPWAIALVVDGSGSMASSGFRERVEVALCELSPRRDALRSLITFGHSRGPREIVDADWGEELCGAMTIGSGSTEFATRAAMSSTELVGWPNGYARGVVIVTDEPPADPGITNGAPLLREWCETNNVYVRIVTQLAWFDMWRAATDACGDAVMITPSATTALSGYPLPCRPPD